MGTEAEHSRLIALDWMRGIVMLLMAIDHSSGEFNAGRLVTDSVFLYKPGRRCRRRSSSPALSPTCARRRSCFSRACRWRSVSLAGSSEGSAPGRSIAICSCGPRHWRGGAGAFVFWLPKGHYLFQVLYAIGTAYLFMIPLRRLPVRVSVALAVLVLLGAEAVIGGAGWGPPTERRGSRRCFCRAVRAGGSSSLTRRCRGSRSCCSAGASATRCAGAQKPSNCARKSCCSRASRRWRCSERFAGVNGLRQPGARARKWLTRSMAPRQQVPAERDLRRPRARHHAALARGARADRARGPPGASHNGPLVVFGQTPMFFYLLHIPLLAITARVLGVEHALGVGAAYGFAALAALVLFPACSWYLRRYRLAHPTAFNAVTSEPVRLLARRRAAAAVRTATW